MIIASAFKRLFAGATATITDNGTPKTETIKFGYGDRDELNAWIIDQNKNPTATKYPLVWYIIAPYTEFQGWYKSDVTLVIMANSQLSQMNEWRNVNNYVGVLEPVWKVVEGLIVSSQQIEKFGSFEDRFSIYDDPNFGIKPLDKDLKGGSENKSPIIDIVDCKVINFKMRMNANCI